jgi:hypothetical protein
MDIVAGLRTDRVDHDLARGLRTGQRGHGHMDIWSAQMSYSST